MRGELYKSNTKRRIKIKMSLAIRSELGINSDVKNGDKFTDKKYKIYKDKLKIDCKFCS